jgi:uncharacterized damage-inducible protein DinB
MDAPYASQILRCEHQLADFFRGVLPGSLNDLSRRAIPDKWSAQENLAHLARYHEIFLERIDRMLSSTRPVFARYRAEQDPEWEPWKCRSYSELIQALSELRVQLVIKLKSLSERDFHRVGVHPRFGEMALSQWLEFFLVHEGHHLYLVFQQVRILQESRREP